MSGNSPFVFALGAGMVATFNPCGFAMLPAYLSYFLGLEDPSADTGASIIRALGVASVVSAGFITVFLMIGLPLSGLSQELQRFLPWLTVVIGAGLVLLGLVMIRGFEPTVALPHLDRGTGSRQLSSMYLFGLSYAIASLSCTLPVFTLTLSVTFTQDSFVSRLGLFVVYALGMALVLMALTLLIALARKSIVTHLRRALPYVNRAAGGLLVLAGAYLAYFGWFELRVKSGDLDPGGPAQWVFDTNSDLANWVQATGPARVALLLGSLVAGAIIVALGIRSGRAPRSVEPDSEQR